MQTMERRKRGQRINVESRNDEALQWSRLESMILLEFPSETSGPNNWRGEESSGIRYRFQGRLALQDGLLFWLSLPRERALEREFSRQKSGLDGDVL